MKRLLICLTITILVLIVSSPVRASTATNVVITATPVAGGGAPSSLMLVFVNDFQIDLSWVKGSPVTLAPTGTNSTVVNTMVRVKWGEPSASKTDGYQVYYGDSNGFSDITVDLTSLTQTPYYRAWSETVFYDAGGDIISSIWEETGTWKEANFMSISWLVAIVALLALGLTFGLFHSRNAILGFPAAIFWALFGGYSYSLSTTTWDIYFMIAFASLLGMVTFCTLGAYGLKTKKEEAEEGDLYFDEGGDRDVKFIDEGGKDKGTNTGLDEDKPRRISRGIRERAERRRARWE